MMCTPATTSSIFLFYHLELFVWFVSSKTPLILFLIMIIDKVTIVISLLINVILSEQEWP